MASVSGFSLDVQVVNNGPNLQANITVDYEIDFSSYDQHSNQAYSEVCRLIGDDTGITPPEDGVDDAIPGGQLLPVPVVIGPTVPPIVIPGLSIVQSDGRTSLHRHLTKTLPLSALNEDQPPTPNPDEIRAQVVLTPILPVAVTRESNQVVLNIS
jgi:hypothetical protein